MVLGICTRGVLGWCLKTRIFNFYFILYFFFRLIAFSVEVNLTVDIFKFRMNYADERKKRDRLGKGQ